MNKNIEPGKTLWRLREGVGYLWLALTAKSKGTRQTAWVLFKEFWLWPTALLGEKRLIRATMQMRLLAAQANVEEKRIAELKARLKENLSLLDRERTCHELTRMQGELIKTSLFPT